ncbi:hypothetical protein NPIL_49461 [Nephila pilipes]|uniref:Uncharacterized protein n=1 Tax=Nephila pilipes TaxID=299642 RepID=A0A8X6Q3A4_NEPPI|nr:hypothetical protein NPIL_49461 [Nephila pilipes]
MDRSAPWSQTRIKWISGTHLEPFSLNRTTMDLAISGAQVTLRMDGDNSTVRDALTIPLPSRLALFLNRPLTFCLCCSVMVPLFLKIPWNLSIQMILRLECFNCPI